MGLLGVVLALLGAAVTVRALRAVFAASHPRQIGAALLFPAGLVLTVVGVLLVAVPDFFAA